MLISCSFCKSKYLVNSADLKPSGRIVQCAKCKNKWYQELLANEKDQIEESSAFSEPPLSDKIKKDDLQPSIPNLPSTYVNEQKVSVLNSILLTLSIVILIGSFLFFRNLDINSFVLLKFYLSEFIFNLKL